MDTIVEGPDRTPDKTAIQRSEGGGLLILPWTKQILCVLWEHFRLLLHVVYYSFVAVFQMFRLEVHLRITDETGRPRVQHVSTSGNPAEFLSSLFDGNGSVFIPGSESLSKGGLNAYAGASHAGALLSGFGADDLCLSLVDDFVIRAQDSLSEDTDDDLCLGHHPSWKRKGHADWEVRVSGECQHEVEEDRYCNVQTETSKVAEALPDLYAEKQDEDAGEVVTAPPGLEATGEKDDSFWDEDDGDIGEAFDEEESRALWDSFTKSSDPYNPLSFSACISTSSDPDSEQSEGGYSSEGSDREPPSRSAGEGSTPQTLRKYRLDCARPSSESESDWDSSELSSAEDDDDGDDAEENERLWELFANPPDPYNPLNFTACAASSGPRAGVAERGAPPRPRASSPAPAPSDSGAESGRPRCSEQEEEEELWNSFSQSADPYHPLHFRACLQSSPTPAPQDRPEEQPPHTQHGARRSKPRLPQRLLKRHCCVRTPREQQTLSPWKKPACSPPTDLHTAEEHGPKKVRFSPLVQVHVIRAWAFAMQAVRKGPWEEMGRDRARFQRRIQETEQAIGYCLHQSHREKMLDYLNHRQNLCPDCEL